MRIIDLVQSDYLSERMIDYIVEHFDLPYNTTIELFSGGSYYQNRFEVARMPDIPRSYFDPDAPLPEMTPIETDTIELIKFGSTYDEFVKVGYLPSQRKLYIDTSSIERPIYPVPIDPPMPRTAGPALSFYHIRTNETLMDYSTRMFKGGKNGAPIDNYEKRKMYQVAVASRIASGAVKLAKRAVGK